MGGGLVMGALEKLYYQPSLLMSALLATYAVSASPLPKRLKKTQPYLCYCRYSSTTLQ